MSRPTPVVPPTVTISARGEKRLRGGHLWVYRSDVVAAEAAAGDAVVVRGRSGRPVGRALYSDRSQIAVRLVTRGDRPLDAALVRERLAQAIAFRERLAIDGDAYRLVHSEGDLLSSLVVDRYGDVLVVQALSQGMDRFLGEVVAFLAERLGPRGILARHDVRAREHEGLDRGVRVLHGEVPERVAVRQGAVTYEADLRAGQKTGLFLDQRENHLVTRGYARGRMLDAFSYDGGFALHAAAVCDEVVAVDVSADSAARLGRNAARHGVRIDVRTANAFDFLREADRAGERFDTVVLDPPAFAPAKAAVPKALAGYKELNLRALKILAPGGVLVTCSCSYHVGDEAFAAMLLDAAVDARADVSVLETRTQSRDHPVLLGVPETRYLKCTILRKLA